MLTGKPRGDKTGDGDAAKSGEDASGCPSFSHVKSLPRENSSNFWLLVFTLRSKTNRRHKNLYFAFPLKMSYDFKPLNLH